jgi:hypothetical protein
MRGLVFLSTDKNSRLGWMVLAILIFFGSFATAQAQGPGVIEGEVTNGTAGSAAVGAMLPVFLHVYDGGVEVDTLETATDADGRFLFDGLATDPELEYWPEVLYLGVPYSTAEPIQFDGEQLTLSTTVDIYETTDDDGTVRLDSVHMIAESFGEVLRISEIHLFGNTGDRTYVGGSDDQGTTVFIPLPEEAVGLAFDEQGAEERFIEVPGGLMDTGPVPPGTETSLAFFSYHLMVTGEEIPVERTFAYPVTVLNILVAQPGLALSSEQLQSRGPQSFQGREYEFYGTQGLAAGAPLMLEFMPLAEAPVATGDSEAPASSGPVVRGASSRGSQGLLLWIGFGLAALAVIGAVVYPLFSQPGASEPESTLDLSSDPKARRLVVELADLNDAFEAGEIDEASYERQRTDKVAELKSL